MATPAVTPVNVEDLYNLSDDDFQKQYDALQGQVRTSQTGPEPPVAPTATEPVVTPQLRDEQGRFTKAPESAPIGDQPEPAQTYRYEIDLGDGGGKQVFEGASYDELVEKLGTAQEHATRKIRELSQQIRTKTVESAAPVTTTEPSAEEEWLLSQAFMTNPTQALRKWFKQEVGMTIEDFKASNAASSRLVARSAEQEAAEAFMAKHPEFVKTQHNGTMIERYLTTLGLESSVENLEQAFGTLSQSGLLQTAVPTQVSTAVPTQVSTEPTPAPSGPARIEPGRTRTVVIQRKAASSLPASRTETPRELTTEDLYNLSDAEFLKLGRMGPEDNW